MTRQRLLSSFLGGCLMTAACISLSHAASAATADRDGSVVVSYDDLNLTTPAGVQRLYGRIRVAARTVCGDSFSVESLRAKQQQRSCADRAIEQAIDVIDSVELRELAADAGSQRV